MNKFVLIILSALSIFLIGAVMWLYIFDYFDERYTDVPGQVACTEEAKLCPDGSYVVRTGLMCEFAGCPTVTSSTFPTDVPYRATLEGEYTCLPPKNTTGPQTLECALGIKDTSGDYYALDTNVLETDELNNLPTGSLIKVEGMITPIEMLSSDHWQKYDAKGIMTVTSVSVK